MNNPLVTALAVTGLSLFTPSRPVLAQDGAVRLRSQPVAESQPLQGSWEGVEVGRESGGKCTITIDGDSIRFQGSNKDEWYKAKFALDLKSEPKQLRATITDCGFRDYVGKVAVAIFKVEEKTLTLVGHEPGVSDTPKTFEGDNSSRSFVFKKVQPQTENSKVSKTK